MRTASVAIGTFADLWLFGDSDAAPRRRDFSAAVVATYACSTCGAPAGQLCKRATIAGITVQRRLPHFGRGGKPGRNAPARARAERAHV